ncbi:ABC transporter permease subunit [Methanoplanus sp. FWC-SCC4]|uniref:ABC transporter permease subunit n=1 Tax=Methanochimaera problematica TaxID=2609417 RepID=A0AA97I4Q3_9EURY|nr:ABC transporter permease subunit [Methanoplanus sp. FWC-SCC4]WOF16606.1 ABC transporter permease subunit [Methanoplanus sp. FWC-SCC4]
MNPIMVVAKKEIRQIANNRGLILGAVLFMGIFGGMTSLGAIMSVVEKNPESIISSLDSLIMYLVLVLGVFTGYFFSSQAFLGEKLEGTIETLLCSPLPLRDIWLGKVLGVMIPSYGVTLLIAGILVGLSNMEADFLVLPSPVMFLYILIVVPVYIACAVGLLGFVQLLLGMKENQIINIALIVGFIAVISVFNSLVTEGVIAISATVVFSMFLFGILMLSVVGFLTRFLNREKIVTTLP